jgi:hypothetical protein
MSTLMYRSSAGRIAAAALAALLGLAAAADAQMTGSNGSNNGDAANISRAEALEAQANALLSTFPFQFPRIAQLYEKAAHLRPEHDPIRVHNLLFSGKAYHHRLGRDAPPHGHGASRDAEARPATCCPSAARAPSNCRLVCRMAPFTAGSRSCAAEDSPTASGAAPGSACRDVYPRRVRRGWLPPSAAAVPTRMILPASRNTSQPSTTSPSMPYMPHTARR